MATYYSDQYVLNDAGNYEDTGVPSVAHEGQQTVTRKCTYSLGGTALALNDIVMMCTLPVGAVVTKAVLVSDDLDTHATPTIVLDLGYDNHSATDDPDAFIDGATIAQGGGSNQTAGAMAQTTGIPDTNVLDIELLVQVGPATGATTGDVTAIISYVP